MNKKTSDELDVGGEDFEHILDFLNEEDTAPPDSEKEQREWRALKALLETPAKNRRALQSYINQNTPLQKGEKIKKAA
jgi:hypothetical protein